MDEERVTLEAEIEELEKKIQEQYETNQLLNKWRNENCSKQIDEDADVTKARLESLSQQMDILKQFSAITFTQNKKEVLNIEGLELDCKQIVEGKCGNIMFKLDMTVKENLGRVKDCHITHLAIAVSKFFTCDMQQHIEWFAENRDVQGFLLLVESYNICDEDREHVLKHFVSAYPDFITIVKPYTLCIRSKKCSIVVKYGLKVSETRMVLPDVQLSLKLPADVEKSHRALLENLDERFNVMTEELGVQDSIQRLVQLTVT